MKFSLKNTLLVTVAVVLAIAVVFAGSALFAGDKTPAAAAGCCGMEQGTSASGHGHMMMGGGTEGCPMQGGAGMMRGDMGCAMMTGKIASIDRDGTLTVKVKPDAKAPDEVKKAIAKLKTGNNVSMMMMLGSGHMTATGAKHAATYACPMHPDVTSDKAGKCSKCGMNLEKPQG